MNARSLATLGIGFGALAVASLGFLGSVQEEQAPIYAAGWDYPKQTRAQIEKERIRLGITKAEATKLKRVIRLATKKTTKPKKEELKQLLNEEGIDWKLHYEQWLYILANVIEFNKSKAEEKKLLYALEQWNILRIEQEELDISFLISMLAAEIYV